MSTPQQVQDAIRSVSENRFLPMLNPQSRITFETRNEARLYVQASSNLHGFQTCVLRAKAEDLEMGCTSGNNNCTWTMDLTLVEEKQLNGELKRVWSCTMLTDHTAHKVLSEAEARNQFDQRRKQTLARLQQIQQQQQQQRQQLDREKALDPPPGYTPVAAPQPAPAPPAIPLEILKQLQQLQAAQIQAQAQLQRQAAPLVPPQAEVPNNATAVRAPSKKALQLMSEISKVNLSTLLNLISPVLANQTCLQKFTKLGNTQYLFLNLLGYDQRMLEAMANLIGLDEKEKIAFLGYFAFSEEVKGWKKILAEKE